MPKAKRNYTDAMLREFDGITEALSSRNQLERITARLNLKTFVEKHGEAVCDEMFAVLQRRDRRRK